MVRCKFLCHFKEINGLNTEHETARINMRPVYTGSEENKNFWKNTPSGYIEFQVVNKAAADQIHEGKEYYIDIIEA